MENLKFHHIRLRKTKNSILWALPVVWGVYNTHSKSYLAFILRVQLTLFDQWFTRYRKSYNFIIIRHQKTKYCIFRALPIVWGVCISENTHIKSSLAVILRGQPALYDQWFARCGFWTIWGVLGPILPPKMGFSHLSAWSPSRSWKHSLRIPNQVLSWSSQ